MAPARQTRNPYALAPETLVIDNGAYNLKAGFVKDIPDLEQDCSIVPNCLAKGVQNKTWVGAQLDDCNDFADTAFRRPVQNGCLVNWEAQKEIWDQTFFAPGVSLECDPSETNLLLTEAPNTLARLQRNCDEIVFEEFEFAAYRRTSGIALNAYNDIAGTFDDPVKANPTPRAAECVLVVDSGYSHTIVAPVYKGRPIQQAVRRLDIGGKFITNYLKEILSLRELNVLNETYIINQVKEAACFVSTDFKSDMEKAQDQSAGGSIVKDYIMPDFTTRYTGELKAPSPADRRQMATFNSVRRATLNERFSPPELIFNPTNVGMRQAGLAEIIMDSLEGTHTGKGVPTGLWPAMLANVHLVGGTINLPGFKERLYNELRAIAPAECTVRIEAASDPVKSTWLAGARWASDSERMQQTMLTRADYLEFGSTWVERYFSGR